MDTNLVIEGLKFMALGMGTVFIFLIILIFFMNIMSTLIHKFFPEPHAGSESRAPAQDSKNNKVIAAITAAITYHRQG